jgi:tetratricopeptide (TPR) repeat protein
MQSYNDSAASLCRKARDNGDTALYDRAQEALQHSFQLSPANYDAEKLQVTVLIGKREYAQALKLATEVNHRFHDDIAGWGLLVDANVAAGDYDAAERAAQWILDLRPGSSLGFEKAAVLREIFGDPEGSAEFFDEAYRRTSPNDVEQRAWLLTQSARVQLAEGNRKRAEELLSQALQLYPDSQLAAAALAKVRASK